MIKPLKECRNDFLSTLYGKLSEFKTCEKLIKKHLPEKLAQHFKITDIKNNTITLSVKNPTLLSLLRYEKLNLLQKLRTDEKMYALRSIELKLEAPHLRPKTSPTIQHPPHFSHKSIDSIDSAAKHCTSSKLRKALERLAETLSNKQII